MVSVSNVNSQGNKLSYLSNVRKVKGYILGALLFIIYTMDSIRN